MLSPGLGTGMPLLDIAASFLAQQGIFPQPQGNNSVMDMMMLRSRNLDQHYIMKRALASSQMAARMGGINMDSPIYQALYPFAAMPDSPLWKVMAPMIGGNPVKAQMGLYADLNGQTLASLGRIGSTTALETDRLMDQLQGRFYRRADFGSYVNSTAPALRRAFGEAGFEQLSNDWSLSTLRNLEGVGATRVNRDMGRLLERSVSRIDKVRAADDLTDDEKSEEIENIRREATTAAESFLSSITSKEAQQKMGKSFAEALQSESPKEALKEFKQEWKEDVQDAFRIVERGIDFRTGKVPGSIDYRFTRGFNIEDLTGSFGAAASAGLIGRDFGLNIGKYTQTAGGALDAARGLFGRDLSGRDLTDEINKLIGIGSINLGNENDARKVEELLRNVKAMARVAGVSIESMKSIIGEAKVLASQNPNLPVGIGGFTASNIAIKAMGDTTAALSYMDPALARILGGPVGINSSRVNAMTQGLGEPVSQMLGALHYRAVQLGGQNSAAAKAIRDYAQNGDTSSIGLNEFLIKNAQSLHLRPDQALNFAKTNPLLGNLGLEQNPEIGQAGTNAFKTTLLREWDSYMGGTAGMGRELLNVALNPGTYSKSGQEMLADVQKRLPRVLTAAQKETLLKLQARAQQKEQNNEGLMTINEVVALAGMPDIRGTAKMGTLLGFDIEFAKQFNPRAKAAHQRIEESRKNTAKLDAFHAANLAELNAPLFQRLIQAGMDGRLEDGLTDEMRRLLGGSPDAPAYAEAIKNLQDAERLYEALPEGRLDAAGNLIGGASEKQLAEVFGKLFPSVDLSAVRSAEKVMGRDDLAKLARLQKAGETISRDLGSGGITTYGQLEEYLGRQTDSPAAMAAAVEARKYSADKKISRAELAKVAARIQQSTAGADTTAIIGKHLGKGVSQEVLTKGAQSLNAFDPSGNFTGSFSLQNLVEYGMKSIRFQSRSAASRKEGQTIVSQLEELRGEDINSAFKALEKMYKGEYDFSSSGLGRYTERINADVLMGIADAKSPAEAMSLAASALSQAGLGDAPADLVSAANQLRKFDSSHTLKGSKKISKEDIIRAAIASKTSRATELFLAPHEREAGETTWDQMVSSSEVTGKMQAKFSKIRKEILGGHGDFSLLLKKREESPQVRRQIDDILAEGEPESGPGAGASKQLFDRYFSQYEETAKNMRAADGKSASANPLAGLDIKGIISAISSLTSAVNSAAKNP